MKSLTVALAFVGLIAVASAESLKSEIEKMDKSIAKAMMKKDLATFEKIVKAGITPDFKYIEDGKSMGFDQMMSMMKQSYAGLDKITSANSTITKFKQSKDTAVATESHSMAATMIGPDKKAHKMTFTGTSVDTYKKVGKEWKMSVMDWKTSKMLLDGKPMDMSKMGGGK